MFHGRRSENLNMFRHVNKEVRAQIYEPACQNFGVPCPKYMNTWPLPIGAFQDQYKQW